MIVSDLAISRRATVCAFAVVVFVAGCYSYATLPRESAPDVSLPMVFVATTYRGVAPSDIETSITTQIEKQLKGLEGVKKVTSESAEGESRINIEFVGG